MNRKKFIQMAMTAATFGTMTSSCRPERHDEPAKIRSDKKYKWKMVTTWPPNYPVIGDGCQLLADLVSEMSSGQMEILVYGGGELVPPLEAFEAVSIGGVDMASSASYYWAGKIPASSFFSGIPFGLNARQMDAWLQFGGGMALWRKLYEPFGLIPFNAGNTGMQMGGWYNRKIEKIDDFKGLKMRMPGLGARVLKKMKATPILSAGSEIYTNLERGVIDATEWIGPYHDKLMGFHEIAKYYYYPGWHECGTVLEMMINKSKFTALPPHLQAIFKSAIAAVRSHVINEMEVANADALQQITEKSDVEVLPFPRDVLSALKKKSTETIRELVKADRSAAQIYQSLLQFKERMRPWSKISEKVYYEDIM